MKAVLGRVVSGALLFFLIPVSPGQAQTLGGASGSITGRVMVRERTNGERSLLVEVKPPSNAQATAPHFDGLRLTLPDNFKLTPRYSPGGWTVAVKGKNIEAHGPATSSLHLRLDLSEQARALDRLIGKPARVQVSLGRNRPWDMQVPVTPLPPVTVLDDIDGILNVPPTLVAGQPFLATPSSEFADGSWAMVFEGTEISLGPLPAREPLVPVDPSGTGFVGDVPREWLVPAFGATGPSGQTFNSRLRYIDPFGEMRVNAPTRFNLKAYSGSACQPSIAGGDSLAFAGQGACMDGCFPNRESWYGMFLDKDIPLTPLAASPGNVILSLPPNTPPGPHTISGMGIAPYSLNVLALEGSIDQNELWRRQSTTMHLKILGSDKPLPLVITNRTPETINVQGGVRQVVSTPGGADNFINRSVRGIARGTFNVVYKLDYPACSAGK